MCVEAVVAHAFLRAASPFVATCGRGLSTYVEKNLDTARYYFEPSFCCNLLRAFRRAELKFRAS
jgi:hypothetical protein